MLTTLINLLTIVLGFSLIIVIHELGHFLAAKWAGVRTLAFAVGFGPALLSWRKGMGLRRGSSHDEYAARVKQADAATLGTTEYRLNILPFGGYVRMLGQDDMDFDVRSEEPDSYQNCRPWKRMVIVSAGVVLNIISAAILFVIVFTAGLKVMPPIAGGVAPGSPAEIAGIRSEDRILSVNGETPDSFNDIAVATMLAGRDTPLSLVIERPGETGLIEVTMKPQQDESTKLRTIGLMPARSGTIVSIPDDQQLQEHFRQTARLSGLDGVRPGATLVTIDGAESQSVYKMIDAIEAARGTPVNLGFVQRDGTPLQISLPARRQLQETTYTVSSDFGSASIAHLLGLHAVMQVAEGPDGSKNPSLVPGDVFARLGSVQFPTLAEGIGAIQQHKGRKIAVEVLRRAADGYERVGPLDLSVDAKGKLGFYPDESTGNSSFVTDRPQLTASGPNAAFAASTTFAAIPPGSQIRSVNGTSVQSLSQVLDAILESTQNASDSASSTITIGYQHPLPNTPLRTVEVNLNNEELASLAALPYKSPVSEMLFEPQEKLLLADSVGGAIKMGLKETKQMMVMVYLTFARLADGTVKVQHLKGPVGIAHVGTILAEKGFVWVLFFMAVISVNLAVINFLPLPIVDGGLFLYIVYEQFTGKAPSPAFQNIAGLAGIALIATVFLVVTFNDIRALFGM